MDDSAYAAATDGGGNVVIAGLTGGSLFWSGDALVAKYDAGGRLLWRRRFGTEEYDRANGVATDARGNVIVAGYSGVGPFSENRNLNDAWVAKYDGGGDLMWKRQLATEVHDIATDVATDAGHNVFVCGETAGSLGGRNRGLNDAWIVKYDGSGHRLWRRQLGTSESEGATGVATDAAGNVVIVGVTGILPFAEGWITKYDGDGHLLWKRDTSGTGFEGYVSGVATDGNGNIAVAVGARAAKYDADGNLLWERYAGDEGGGNASAVATDGVGSVLVAGASFYSGGTSVAWVTKLDATGDQVWTRRLLANEYNVAYGVATDGIGDVFISGWTDGSLGGSDHGGYDAFVAKYSTRR
jgi:hypothetical protein